MLSDFLVLLKQLQEAETRCNRCGLCQSVCPVYRQTGRESDVARGRLALIDGLASEILKRPETVRQRLEKCLLCGACTEVCSRRVNTLEIFIKARLVLAEYTGLSFFSRLLLRSIVSRPALFDRTTRFIQRHRNILFKKGTDGNFKMRLYSPWMRGRELQLPAPVPFRSMALKTESPSRLFFFAGCLIDRLEPEIGISCLKALSYHGFPPIISTGEACCGMPSLAAGDRISFNRLVEHNLDIFRKHDPEIIVTACATCTFTIKKLWPMLYSGPEKEAILSVSEKVADIHSFLAGRKLTVSFRKSEQKVTIHDPCHLKKSLNVSEELRYLLGSVPGLQICEMEGADNCCGFGGTFNLKYYGLSSEIAVDKCRSIAATGADIVATGCPACMFQLRDQLARNGHSTKVRHIMDLYAAALPD